MSVDRAEGESVAADVPAARSGSAPLVRAGATVSPGLLRGLQGAGVAHLWVEDDRVHAGDLLPAEIRQGLTERLHDVFQGIHDRGLLSPEAAAALAAISAEALRHLALPSATPHLCDPAPRAAFDARHALGTCALGLMLATHLAAARGPWAVWLGASRHGGVDAGLTHLGRGLLLCDVAKHVRGGSPEAVREGRAKVLEEVGPFALATVLHHDDRSDDPAGAPPALARIAAVADGVDARVRAAGPEVLAPQAEALRWAATEAGGRFDRAVVQALLECLAPYPPGSTIELPDGEQGLVVEVERDAPGRCRVELGDGRTVEHDATVLVPEPVA